MIDEPLTLTLPREGGGNFGEWPGGEFDKTQ